MKRGKKIKKSSQNAGKKGKISRKARKGLSSLNDDINNTKAKNLYGKAAENALAKREKRLGDFSLWNREELVHELEVHQIELEMQNDELKRAQTEIENSRVEYADLYDFAPVTYFTLDKNGLILKINLTGASLLGRERSHLINKPFSLFIAEESKSLFYSHLRRVFKTKDVESNEVIIKTKSGVELKVISKSLFLEGKANGQQCITVAVDISNTKRLERELLSSFENWRKTFDSDKDLIMLLDKDFTIQKVNISVMDFLGKKEEELIGKKCFQLMHGMNTSPDFCPFNRVKKSKRREMADAFIEERGLWIRVTVDPILDNKGDFTGAVHIVEDITEEKKTHDDLRENEKRFRMLFENMTSAVAIYEAVDGGEDFIFKEFNMSAERTEKIKREELLGKRVKKVFPGVETFGIFDVFKRVWKTGKPEHFPVNLYKDKRIQGWRDNHIYKLPSGEVVAIYDDVTEKMQAAQGVEFEHKQLLSIFDSIQEVIYVTDPKTYEVIYVNKYWRDVLGKDPIGKKCYEAFQGYKHPCGFCTNKIITKLKGKPYTWEYYNPMVGRDYMIVDRIIKWPDGRDVRFEFALDITDRKKAESELRLAKFSIDRASDSVFWADSNANIVNVNDAACRSLGYSKKELLKMKVHDFDPDFTRQRWPSHWEDLKKRKSLIIETRHRRKDGTIFPVEMLLNYFDYGGKEMNFAFARDISERKRIDEMKDNLVRNVTHEFKTPVAMMQMALEISQLGFENKDLKEIYRGQKIAMKNVERLRRDMDHILEMFKLEIDPRSKKKKSCHLKGIVKDIAKSLKQMCVNNHVSIAVEISERANKVPMRESDARTMLSNLIENAVKFTNNGKVSVSSGIKGNKLVLKVKDTGCGIIKENRKRVFEKFEQRHASIPGTGLGLFIVKEIAESYNGKIKLDSKGRGKGVTFTVELPI
ncbi:MAG: PAS domain S-box protein [Pseudomonadota bacterium]